MNTARELSALFPPSPIHIDISPLISAIADHRSVVFVGAGASIAAGLPNWCEFLKRCLNRAKKATPDESVWGLTDKLLRDGEYLIAAELLQRGIGSQLDEYVWDEFAAAQCPSDIHYSIARIPFSLAVTTNYDRLLEGAYEPLPSVRTWRDAEAIFSAIKNNRFAVVKTHGDVGNRPSLVLTKSEYRDLMQLNESFSSCLRMLLSLRTLLFVGSSLRDPDLLKLMDEARLMYSHDFGPHYAILFRDEVDNSFLEFLKESYAIETILCESPPSDAATDAMYRTSTVAAVLREISGRVAWERHRKLKLSVFGGVEFHRRAACDALLKHAVELTGSMRGDICLTKDDQLQVIYRAALCVNRGSSCDGSRLPSAPYVGEQISHDSIIGRVYIQRKVDSDYVYISDVRYADQQLADQGFANTRYKACHPEVKSELACPILSEGQRIGVINVEANRFHAYTRDHLQVLQGIAEQIGWACVQTKQRIRSTQGMDPHLKNFDAFNRLMQSNRLLQKHDMQYLLYGIDYSDGLLRAHFDRDRLKKIGLDADSDFEYRFSDRSLATRALHERRRILVPDADTELEKGDGSVLAAEGCRRFGIRGPVEAMPVIAHGTVSAVLVTWSAQLGHIGPDDFRCATERAFRRAHLIANEPGNTAGDNKAKRFLEYIDQGLKIWDDGRTQLDQDVSCEERLAGQGHEFLRDRVFEVLADALIKFCNLRRVRYWSGQFRDKPSRANLQAYRLKHSFERRPSQKPAGMPDTLQRNSAAQRLSNDYDLPKDQTNDPFLQHTLTRFENDPYARVQHGSMFAQRDPNADRLRKAKDGSWIVGPVVHRRAGENVLLGYVTADTHYIPRDSKRHEEKPVEEPVDAATQTFQRFAIDVVTDMLERVYTVDQPDLSGDQLDTPHKGSSQSISRRAGRI